MTGGDGDHRPDPRPGSDRKLRLAASSPNIKAIFDANPGGSAFPRSSFRPPQGIPEQPPPQQQQQQQDYPPYYPTPPPVPNLPHQYQQHSTFSAPGQHQPGPFPPQQSQQPEYHWGMPRGGQPMVSRTPFSSSLSSRKTKLITFCSDFRVTQVHQDTLQQLLVQLLTTTEATLPSLLPRIAFLTTT